MAEPFETLREVGVALDGFRADVSGQFTTLKWIIGGVSVLGLGVAALLFNKVDALEETAARNTAILERIEASVRDVASNTNEIKETVQAAAVSEPAPGLIAGWKGVPLSVYSGFEEFNAAVTEPAGNLLQDAWIYFPPSEGGEQ